MKNTIIGICDDQPIVLHELEQIITESLKQWNCQWELRSFLSGQNMLEQADELTIAFLDIDMPAMDGIELGRRIKEINSECHIIMATGRVERFKEAFMIQAFRFITKPFQVEEIREALSAIQENEVSDYAIELYYQRNKVAIPQKDIQYIEAYDGYAELLVGFQRFRKDCSLDELEQELDARFFVRISRKNIVNLRWVKAYKKDKIQIREEYFTISRRRRKEFEAKYIEYDLRYKGRR